MGSRRWVGVVAAGLLAVPLGGCTLRGDAWLDGESFSYDVVVTYDPEGPSRANGLCTPESWPDGEVSVTEVEAPPGEKACRIVGEDRFGDEGWSFVEGLVVRTPDHLFLRLPPLAFVSGEDAFTGLDLTLHTPGDVLVASAGATVWGNSATWRDASRVETEGLSLTARAQPGLPGWVLPGGAGILAGVGIALVVRRAARRTPADEEGRDA